MIFLRNYFIATTDGIDVISIIHEINRTVRESAIPDGVVTVMVPAPGGAVTVLEPLPDIVDKLRETVLSLSGGEGEAETKDRRKEPVAVGPRIAAAVFGKSLQIPLSTGKLVLGPREEVVLIDAEREGRRREFCVQVMGEVPQPAQPQRQAPPRRR